MQQKYNRALASSARRKVKDSTVLNRMKLERSESDTENDDKQIKQRKRLVQNDASRHTAREIKDAEIQKAIRNASSDTNHKKHRSHMVRFGIKNTVLALACAAVAVFAIVYFVNINTPDITLKVAAIQSGIAATYPKFVPRDYSLSSITSENGKIVLNFTNLNSGSDSENGADEFLVIEEKSSWDSNAVYTNYVKTEYGEDYTTIKEQGLTIYIDGSNAAWVNGGIFYKIVSSGNILTKKQIKAIAVSL